MTGHTEDYIWEQMPLALGQQHHCQWWQKYACEVMRFDALLRCIGGSKETRSIHIVSEMSEQAGNLV